ncbi:phosphoglycerate dehydrogenase [Desulforamulus aquiferis]|uniref:D-3-phosphoglycerate dehydrogenase n=1 Tax=Desulforamulus aquiferis TaxID=1397668 RepID=A0AAW7ZKG2_9FIRM|nr:phosphoglycerate dehydrogenase [Desulforamulus aquiferis]MDO7788820.1 phosphoglycerate dehydrogenase [Desulforamulus aquiferis]
MKVLVMDGVSEQGLAPLRQQADIEVVIGEKMTEDQLVEVIGDYDGMIVRSATKVTERVVEAAKKLKVIGRAGVGVDNIDRAAATNKGILVVNAPDGNTIAAAEHTMAMMLGLARKVPAACGKLKNGCWDKKAFLGVELRGKTLGVIGLGRIGSAVAKRAQAMEMNIIAYDPYISEEHAKKMAIEIVTLNELYARADFITVHMPKTKETYHMINKESIALMKEGVRIINCARGGIVDEAALYEAMIAGKVAGAALDVFETEPNTDSPLIQLDNFIATPHLGASTAEAQINVAVDVAEEIVAALRGEIVKNAVNMPSMSPKLLAKIRPFLDLAEKLGKFQAQMLNGRVEKVEVVYSGDLARYDVNPITTILLKGLLDPILQENVNFVNAPLVAKNRGITVVQTTTDNAEDYNNLITVTIYTDKGKRILAGTLFQNNDSRIVNIDGYRINAATTGHMLVVPHIDKPRIVGRVGTLVGDKDINIAGMQVGRIEIGGKAIMVMMVDNIIPQCALDELAKIDGVLEVKMVSL